MQVGATYDSGAGQWNVGKWHAVMGSGPHDATGRSHYNGYSAQLIGSVSTAGIAAIDATAETLRIPWCRQPTFSMP